MTMRHASKRIVTTLMAAFLGVTAAAQEAPVETNTTQESLQPVTATSRDAVQSRLAALKAIALKAAEALPEGDSRVLRAVVMEWTGKVQWRSSTTSAWKRAAKDDILEPGAMIRTGLRSWMMLRVGINSHVFVDGSSRVVLPEIAHAGDTLRTTVQVERGRADINVGHVGLTNDFSVLTPSGALAVRGTGLAVAHDALKGTRIFGARTNAMNSIAMRYYGKKATNLLSGEAMSTQRTPDPAAAEALEASGPPPLMATEAQDREDAPDMLTQAVSNTDPVNQSTRILLAEQQETINEEILEETLGDPFEQVGFDWYFGPDGVVLPEDQGAVATALYWDMKLQEVPPHVDPYNPGGHRIASAFEGALFAHTGWRDPERTQFVHGSSDGGEYLLIPWGTPLPTGARPLPETYESILEYGDANWSGQPFTGPDDLRTMLAFVNEFCMTTFDGNGNQIEVCRQSFANAMNWLIYNDMQPPGYVPGLTPYGQGLQNPGGGQVAIPAGSDCPWCP